MKFIIDTEKKTILLEEDVTLQQLSDLLGKMFPDGDWKEYTLLQTEDINWNKFIPTQSPQPMIHPGQPYWGGTNDFVYGGAGSTSAEWNVSCGLLTNDINDTIELSDKFDFSTNGTYFIDAKLK